MVTRRTRDALGVNDDPSGLMPVDNVAGELDTIDNDEPQSDADRVANMLSQASTDERAYVKVSREADAGKVEWCANYTVGDFQAGGFEMIRRDWGPGSFHIVLYGIKPGSNYFGYRAKERVTVAKRLTEAPSHAASQSQLGDVAAIMRAMQEQNAAFQATLLQALTTRPDPMSQMKSTLELVTMMRGAFGLDQQSKSPIAEVIAGWRELREVSGELQGDGKEDTILSALPKLLEIVQLGMQQQSERSSGGNGVGDPVALIQTPASIAKASDDAPQAVAASASAPVEIEPTADELQVQEKLTEIVAMQGDDSKIESASQIMDEFMPDELIDLLERDDWWLQLAQFMPTVAPFQQWYTAVRTRALELVYADTAPEKDDAQPAA